MPRYIDADKLKTELDAWARIIRKPNCYSRGDALHVIDTAPEVKAVPMVRCGECRYRQKAKVNRKGFLICPASGMEITDDDYCSYGAKKEGKP
jgi:hypothetical protein